MKRLLIASVFICVFIILYVNPYGMYQANVKKASLVQLLSDPYIREELFETDTEISEINAVGKNIYKIKLAEDNTFLIEYSQEKFNYYIQVYEQGMIMEIFGFK